MYLNPKWQLIFTGYNKPYNKLIVKPNRLYHSGQMEERKTSMEYEEFLSWIRRLCGWAAQAHTHFSSVTQLCPALCNPMNLSTPGLPVHHQLPEFTQTHVHWVGDAIQPSHPLSSPSPPARNPSHHQGHFQWVNSLHQVAKVLEFQLQHQSFQWTPRTDLL